MKITEYISNTIDRLPKGYVFTYADFIGEVKKKEAVIKALNRMSSAGKISKLSKGKYYKSKETPFGDIGPDRYQVVKDLLEEDGKPIGYITGLSIYNQLGFTTQVSNTIQVGRNEIRPRFKRGRYTIAFIRQKNIITKDNISLLQLLDVIRYIKKIPDATLPSACTRMLVLLKKLSSNDLGTIVRLSLKYPPATRALLGALLEEIGEYGYSDKLLDTLNPISTYEYTTVEKVLANTKKWNIV